MIEVTANSRQNTNLLIFLFKSFFPPHISLIGGKNLFLILDFQDNS